MNKELVEHPNVKKFLDKVKADCKKYGVSLQITKTKYIKCDGIRVGGFFDGENKIIKVAGGHQDALDILVHEYAHMTQWMNKKSIWYTNEMDASKFYSWLEGKRVKFINEIIDEIQELEIDCERRSVKLIKKYDLPINLKMYIKKANAYMFFYEHIKETRKWSSPKNSPYANIKIVDACPDKMLRNYKKHFEKIKHIYREQNI